MTRTSNSLRFLIDPSFKDLPQSISKFTLFPGVVRNRHFPPDSTNLLIFFFIRLGRSSLSEWLFFEKLHIQNVLAKLLVTGLSEDYNLSNRIVPQEMWLGPVLAMHKI